MSQLHIHPAHDHSGRVEVDFKQTAQGDFCIGDPESGHELHCGYGKCSVCKCAGFTGDSNICNRCGHSFAEHW
jgi:hypothetical protein